MAPVMPKGKRLWLVLIVSVVFICASGVVSSHYVHGRAWESVDILRPAMAADARFTDIRVSHTTTGAVVVEGEVKTAADLAALKRIINELHPPMTPNVQVDVTSSPK